MSQLTRVARRAGWVLGALAALTLAGPPGGTAQSIRAMEEAADRYRSVQALCADFEQVLEVRLLGRTVESSGRLCQQRPNYFAMRFEDPDGDMVISDGSFIWVYYPSLYDDQVSRFPASQSPGRYDFFQEFLDDPSSKYDAVDGGFEDVAGKSCQVVELTPKGQATYRKARLWLDPETDLFCQLEVHHENGSLRTVTLRGLRLNPQIASGEFSFVVPEGARVVDPPS